MTSVGFYYTVVYGYNRAAERMDLWRRIKRYYQTVAGPWMLGGDFNNVLHTDERLGSLVSLAEIKPFQECLMYCELRDIKAMGSFFTWNNKHEVETLVYSRIDRSIINEEWMQSFPDSYAYFMPEGYFDHCPCVVYLQGLYEKRKPAFRYFNMWALDINFKTVVTNGWNKRIEGTPMFQVVSKLKGLKHDLKNLNKGILGDIENKVHVANIALTKIQEELRQNPKDLGMVDVQRELTAELALLQQAWHKFLAQKVKADWLAQGDDNTHFFHAQIKSRSSRNKTFLQYYEGLLGSSKNVDPICGAVIKAGRILHEEHHRALLAEVANSEIKAAMFDINGNKAPGPDGYGSQFFKDTWEILWEWSDLSL
ncbi:uncharacterized protein LOC141595154 [Silene latifolia]|uniref:uncharacterized protein LOC141595154 n=1 Tax=Silene latifolia TaxID=37657 RepID=UPI003D77CAEB